MHEIYYECNFECSFCVEVIPFYDILYVTTMLTSGLPPFNLLNFDGDHCFQVNYGLSKFSMFLLLIYCFTFIFHHCPIQHLYVSFP